MHGLSKAKTAGSVCMDKRNRLFFLVANIARKDREGKSVFYCAGNAVQ